jgi:phosphatidylinositol phospholipase C delta
VPAPHGRSGKKISAYLFAELIHAVGDLEWRSKKVKTQHTEGEGADVMWQSQFEWEYDTDDMAFLRFVFFLNDSSESFFLNC